MKKFLVCIVMVGASFAVTAQDSKWRFLAGLGSAGGGEKITSGTLTTIGTNKVLPFDIQAGVGIQKRIGLDYRLADRFTLQGSIGHSVSEAMGIDGSMSFTTVPVELMGFVDVAAGLRIGAGVRQSSADLQGTGLAANASVNGTFVASTGAVLELQYLFANAEPRNGKSVPQFGISVRSVGESFNHALGTLNGDHYEIGLVVYY